MPSTEALAVSAQFAQPTQAFSHEAIATHPHQPLQHQLQQAPARAARQADTAHSIQKITTRNQAIRHAVSSICLGTIAALRLTSGLIRSTHSTDHTPTGKGNTHWAEIYAGLVFGYFAAKEANAAFKKAKEVFQNNAGMRRCESTSTNSTRSESMASQASAEPSGIRSDRTATAAPNVNRFKQNRDLMIGFGTIAAIFIAITIDKLSREGIDSVKPNGRGESTTRFMWSGLAYTDFAAFAAMDMYAYFLDRALAEKQSRLPSQAHETNLSPEQERCINSDRAKLAFYFSKVSGFLGVSTGLFLDGINQIRSSPEKFPLPTGRADTCWNPIWCGLMFSVFAQYAIRDAKKYLESRRSRAEF